MKKKRVLDGWRPSCDVANGLCGAWQEGVCFYYVEPKMWLVASLRKRIIQCKHRQKINKMAKLFMEKEDDI